ncbi:F-box/kelch-repeat protein At3g06240-like isoform X2 [Spinacia oleracea]|nr:F-box/kelch-repeat protein At3g06240-like isoform X2 [Spinacia oleracea]XP_056697978.1 F-box/kelch-repeat protein At3g06240-like isoform X2 [Spinacia oleracea]
MEEEEQSKMLPEEMIVEVLLRLPAKSVGRFRCVSNRWSCLLTEPQFIKSHLNRIKQHPTTEEPIFFCSPDSGIFYSTQLNNAIAHHLFDEMTCFAARLTFDDHRFYSSHRPDGSCDGLILMKNDHLNKLFLINPITREVKELPSLSYAPESHVSCNTYGLGHDSINDDYKVVMISHNMISRNMIKPYCMCVDVYSVRNGTWKRVDNSSYDLILGEGDPGFFIDGSIYWIARKASDDSYVISYIMLLQHLILGKRSLANCHFRVWLTVRRNVPVWTV